MQPTSTTTPSTEPYRPHPARVTAGARHRPRRRPISANRSRFVALMKFVLPIAAMALAGLVVAWPQLQSRIDGFRLGYASISPGEAENLRMVKARFTATDKNALPYVLSADLAVQESPGADVILLNGPQADIFLADGTWLGLAADTGRYSQSEQILELTGAVNLFHDSGYEAHSNGIRVDLAEGVAKANAPVVGQGPFGELEAQGFVILDRGRTVHFTGRTKLVIYPDAEMLVRGERRAEGAGR